MFPAFVPALSIACWIVSVVRIPNITGSPVCRETVAIPFENVKDLEEIPQVVKDGLKIIPVKTADEVLKIALSKPLQPIKEVGDFFENLLKTPSKPQGEIVQ